MEIQLLRQLELFKNLDSIQLSHIVSIMQALQLPKNAVLFKEDDPSSHLYVIAKGKIRISKIIPGIGEEALAILSAGAYFGEMELIETGTPRVAQALAHEACELWALPYKEFLDLLNADHQLAHAFLWNMSRTLVRRLTATNEKVTAMFALAKFG